MDYASFIAYDGVILTMDYDNPRAEAIAVGQDGRIIAVASAAEIEALANGFTVRLNLRGRTLMPGFFDCHMHLLWLGLNLGTVNLASPPVASKEDILRLLRGRMKERPEEACLQGSGYDQNRLPGRRHLDRHDLDAVSRAAPIRIEHTSGHAAVVNSRALLLLGIDRHTLNPAGGEIVRDSNGDATGLLLESACWANLDRIIPEQSVSEKVDALGRADAYLLEHGITSATDADVMPSDIAAYRIAVDHDLLRVRTNLMVDWNAVAEHSDGGAAPTSDDLQPQPLDWHRLHVGQAKLFADGAITTRTCLLREPFAEDSQNYGIAMHAPDELDHLIRSAHDAGWQVATHAIGDRAIDEVLSCYARAQRENTRVRPDHRIEHCMLLDRGLIGRLRRQKVWSIGQPEFLTRLGDAYISALGAERAARLSPYATLDAENVAQAFSSDCPVVPGSPLAGIRAAIQRATSSGVVLAPEERISAETALYAYTAAPAFASRVERDRGTLERGKWADFVLLSADPLVVTIEEWDRLEVQATFVAGKCLWGEGQLQ